MADIEQFVPAESDAAFQQRQSQYLADIFGRSHNYEQAQKDVSAARAMMGSVRVQQAIQQGADPAQAYYSNMHYFVQPNDKGFSGVMQQLRPVPPPYATNFPGISAPVVIAPTRTGQTVHFAPKPEKPEQGKLFHVGNALVRINPDGKQETLFQSNDPSKVDTWQHQYLTGRLRSAEQSLRDLKGRLFGDESKASPEWITARDAAQTAVTNATKELLDFTSSKTPKPKADALPVNQPASRIRVREKSSGKLGWWEGSDALPSDYEKVE